MTEPVAHPQTPVPPDRPPVESAPDNPPRRWRRFAGGALLLLSALAAWMARPVLFPPAGDSLTGGGTIVPAVVTAQDSRISILLVGDTHFGENYFARFEKTDVLAERGYSYPVEGLRRLAASAHLVIANLETPLTSRHTSPLGWFKVYLHWGEPERAIPMLKELGIRAVTLANNHAYDQLSSGLADTLDALDRGGLAAFGAGSNVFEAAKPYRLELRFGRRLLRMAVLGTCESTWAELFSQAYATNSGPGVYALTEGTVAAQIQALKRADPDLFVVVYPHWGKNYAWRSSEQARLGHAMIDAGADLVVGHGAHLLDEVEPYRGRLILYGLGNFFFLAGGRYGQAEHSFSLAARLDFQEQEEHIGLHLRLHIIESNNRLTRFRPAPVTGVEFERASRLILEGGTLPGEARARLKELARSGIDEVGPYLDLDLGRVGGR